MATLAELVRDRANVPGPVVEHLQRLVGTWGSSPTCLFPTCCCSYLRYARRGPPPPWQAATVAGEGRGFVVIGQVRPTTSQTLHLEDLLGREVA